MLSPQELIKLPWEDLEDRLRMMTKPQVLEVFNELAQDPDLTATKIVEATGTNRVLLVDRVCGNPSKNITGTGKSFMIGPTKKGDVVHLENGSRNNRTRHIEIKAPMPLPANQAILALDLFGAGAEGANRNRLREYSSQEMAEFYGQPVPKAPADPVEPPPADPKAKKSA